MFPLFLLDNVTHASLSVVTLFGLDAGTEGPVFNKTQLLYMYITIDSRVDYYLWYNCLCALFLSVAVLACCTNDSSKKYYCRNQFR